jgi:hypothetical protein
VVYENDKVHGSRRGILKQISHERWTGLLIYHRQRGEKACIWQINGARLALRHTINTPITQSMHVRYIKKYTARNRQTHT